MPNNFECIVVGAGLAGLSLSRRLQQAGKTAPVLERSTSVGGRVATRELEGHIFDYGPVFFHGRDSQFVDFFEQWESDKLLAGWPKRVRGRGLPCQPEAFAPNQTRWAWRGGMRPVLQRFRETIPVELGKEVLEIRWTTHGWEILSAGSEMRSTPTLFLALAHEQNLALLSQVDHPVVQNLVEGLSLHSSLASLTLAAHYRNPPSVPDWDIWYPETSNLLLLSNESSKHGGEGLTLVYQAKPVWSRNRMERSGEDWTREILQEACLLLGDWAASPDLTHSHRWKYARLDSSSYLPRPVMTRVGDGWLGLAGDLYLPNRGLEASWLSGIKLAEAWLEAQNPI